MKILITGASGFVGIHLLDLLMHEFGADAEIIPTSRGGDTHPVLGPTGVLDITDEDHVYEAISVHRPTHVVNLAGIAASTRAAVDPKTAWNVHLHGPLNIAQAIMARAPECFLLNVGSGLVYGQTAREGGPLKETALLAPVDHYSVTKASADLALGALVAQGLRCIRFRPFNHTGPGQAASFVIPSFATQIARIEAGLAPPVMKVGNLDTERDFLDVRDVVRAYCLAIKKTDQLVSGSIVNVASGRPRNVREILTQMLRLSRRKIYVEQEVARFRSSDISKIFGDASYARNCLGWDQNYSFEDTIIDVLNYCRSEVAKIEEAKSASHLSIA